MVRQLLEARREGREGAPSLEELRRAMEAGSREEPPGGQHKKRLKLADQKLQGQIDLPVKPKAIPPTSPKPRAKPTRTHLRDAVFFKSDEEHQTYLMQQLQVQGISREIYERLRSLHVTQKDVPRLMELWDHLPDLGLSPAEVHLETADTLRQMDMMDRAMVHLEQAASIEPENLQAVKSIAMCLKLKKDYETALHWIERWKKLDPHSDEQHYQMGSIYHRMGNPDLARANLRRCLELNPKHITARSLLEKVGY